MSEQLLRARVSLFRTHPPPPSPQSARGRSCRLPPGAGVETNEPTGFTCPRAGARKWQTRGLEQKGKPCFVTSGSHSRPLTPHGAIRPEPPAWQLHVSQRRAGARLSPAPHSRDQRPLGICDPCDARPHPHFPTWSGVSGTHLPARDAPEHLQGVQPLSMLVPFSQYVESLAFEIAPSLCTNESEYLPLAT